MDSLYEIVRHEVRQRPVILDGKNWSIRKKSNAECEVISDEIIIIFHLDVRNGFVSSGIIFPEIDENLREELQTHVLSKLMEDVRFCENTAGMNIAESVRVEVENVRRILTSMNKHHFTSRDLTFFHDGYSSAYTDYVSQSR